MEKAMNMFRGVGWGHELWVEVLDNMCYLVYFHQHWMQKNRPKLWIGNKTSLKYLHIIACEAYVHVPKENRSKYEKNIGNWIFIWYKDDIKFIRFETHIPRWFSMVD